MEQNHEIVIKICCKNLKLIKYYKILNISYLYYSTSSKVYLIIE